MRIIGFAILALSTLSAAHAQGVDPLTAEINAEDAHRFVEVFEAADGAPTAEQLQQGYLDGAGVGVEIFTPGRIENAQHLADYIAANQEQYRHAIDVCLPAAEAATADLRAIYLAFRGMMPDAQLPEIHVVFGAGNSGGTAGPNAQVLGLEVLCEGIESPDDLRPILRTFLAHEPVHSLQDQTGAELDLSDPLLAGTIHEGVADFIAFLVTGAHPSPEREAFGREREAMLWAMFNADREPFKEGWLRRDEWSEDNPPPQPIIDAGSRWIGNYKRQPEGWPWEMGYWIGMQIASAYYDRAPDKYAAVQELLAMNDPQAILDASGYADRFAGS